MLKSLLLLVLVLVTSLLYAQNAFKGKVINEQTGHQLPFVNIGIIGKNVGTVSDIDGIFQIELDDGGLSFSGLFGVKSFYVKVTSQGERFKLPIASVGFWMKIKY